MKTKRCLLSMIIMCMISISCAAQKTLSEVSNIKGVTSIYIGNMMLKMAGSSIDFGSDQEAVDIGKLVNDLTSIEIVQCDGNSMEKAEKVCKKVLSKLPLEVVTEVSKDDQKVEISGVFNKDGKTMSMLLIAVEESSELVYIILKGKISIATLNEALISD